MSEPCQPLPGRSELILGGQKSGKTARAESLAARWIALSPVHRAVYLATAAPADEEMRERIARHRSDRARRVPGMTTLEAADALAPAIGRHSEPRTLIVVDCLTLWLTGRLLPAHGAAPDVGSWSSHGTQAAAELVAAIRAAPGPLVLVSNEIGLGVVPLGREVRAFVDALGSLNQQLAAACERVTLMAAGLPLTLKGVP
jgi:adenosylcobinamide kinase/adenosylcobinamide-phosphate guanylyltransferase